MKGFILGLLVAAAAVGGYLFWKDKQKGDRPQPAAAPDASAPAKERPRKSRRRGAARMARAAQAQASRDVTGGRPAASAVEKGFVGEPGVDPEPPPEPEPEPVKLSAAELKSVAQGDDLSRPDIVRMDLSDDSGTGEITQDEIDARFRTREAAILDCISRARPDPESYVPGRVTVKFRIARSGFVRGVRVEAPAILQKGGIFSCIKTAVGSLRFPASGGSQIVTYPFSLS